MSIAPHRRRLCATTLALSALALGVGTPAATHARQQGKPSAGDLFVATTSSGSLERAGAGRFELTLEDPGKTVTAFADRPARSTSTLTPRRFVRDWKANGFAADPPNAALVLDRAPAGRDVLVVELSRPRITRAGAIAFRAKRLKQPSGALAGYRKRADRRVPSRFTGASLFIDASQPTTTITVNVSMPAATVSVLIFNTETQLVDPPTETRGKTQINGSATATFLGDNGLTLQSTAAGAATISQTFAVAGTEFEIDTSYGTGASGTISINGGPVQTLPSGDFNFPPS